MDLFGRLSIVAFLGAILAGPVAAQEAASAKHALLVGCSRYPSLANAYQLNGPANDVVLWRDFLVDRFKFSKDNVVILAEDETVARAGPTRANIEKEFQRLAKEAKKGDLVVITMSGHGSQQPQREPDNPEHYEPDGLDQVFLPSDIGPWDNGKQTVRNAIVDKDLKAWLEAIRQKGASLVVIIDACHSATMVRGSDAEVLREVPVSELVPKGAIRKAQEAAAKHGARTRGGPEAKVPFKMVTHTPKLVAIYAAQRTEPTVERKMPMGDPEAKRYGLLTYTLVQTVTQSPTPLTYVELVQRIQSQYIAWNRTFPTPLVEGEDRDREFLGTKEWPGRSRFLIGKDDDGWKVSGGAIHGLTAGSILAVYPPAGQPDADKPIGHVKIERPKMLDSPVKPVAYAKMPAPKELPSGSRCEVVYTDYGAQKLRVAVDGDHDKLAEELMALATASGSVVEIVKDAGNADWLLRVQDGKVVLVPATGAVKTHGNAIVFGPFAIDDQLRKNLTNSLGTIARARSLVSLAGAVDGERRRGDGGPDVVVELWRFPGERGEGRAVPWDGRGLTLEAGDWIGFRIQNKSKFTVDVSLLFVDASYGIAPYFPEPGVATDNRIAPGATIFSPRARVNDKTTGLEHVVVIVVKSQFEQALNFGCLAQPSLEKARAVDATQRAPAIDTPLAQLLQHGLYGAGQTRGLTRTTMDDHSLRLISWQTGPQGARGSDVPDDSRPTLSAGTPAPALQPPTPAWQLYTYIGGGVAAGMFLFWLFSRTTNRASTH
ncbi:MAG: caspase family protein [Gemmataceae bacterium]|nr:caspase family protein [Gemmataceae bacterium]